VTCIKRIFGEGGKEKKCAIDSVSNCLSFKEQMKQHLISRLLEMAERENEHLNWLIDNDAPSEIISKSSSCLSHLRQRHKEYNDYVFNINWAVANAKYNSGK